MSHRPVSSDTPWTWGHRVRSHVGLRLLRLALWALPPCRYRSELSAALWTLNFRVQAHVAVLRSVDPTNDTVK